MRLRMRARNPALALLLASVLAAAPASAGPRLYPLDEGVHDPAMLLFRQQLQEAAAAQDGVALLELVSPEVANSFGDDFGHEEFARRWRLSEGAPGLWPVLATMLAGGGRLHPDDHGNRGDEGCGPHFAAPWWSAAWPVDHPAEGYGVALGSIVPVYDYAAPDAPVVDHLSWNIVRVGEENEEWIAVQLEDGRVGAVAKRLVRRPLGWQMVLQRCDGHWRIAALLGSE